MSVRPFIRYPHLPDCTSSVLVVAAAAAAAPVTTSRAAVERETKKRISHTCYTAAVLKL